MNALPDPVAAAESPRALAALNAGLEAMDAAARLRWGLDHLAGPHVLSSSFGAQAAAMLHLVASQAPGTTVVLVDTGYLFPETHAFKAQLLRRLDLDLHVVEPDPARAWGPDEVARLESLGVAGIEAYNRVHKVEPMQRALRTLGARTWLTGLRRQQSRSRSGLPVLELVDGRWKLHPLVDWRDRDIGRYLAAHDLPWHPLWSQGYVSIGDTHSSRPLDAGSEPEQTRFFGLKRECGLHEPAPAGD
ncbi:MAG: phosphoadenylyl-sulfate reductase [Lysobacteraceae bacterium]